ncbi:hypothetical protein AB0G49_14270 [Streptomyces longwoodensis]|uniref:hypothetical protein n=1 Tax=Streptomyces longwoodensis TaxID=68231 RepID=UPI0033FCA508
MTSPLTDTLLAYWRMADRHKEALDQYRDLYGEPDDTSRYDDTRTTNAIEASDFLDAAMESIARRNPLPPGCTVTLPGANGATYTVTTGDLNDAARAAFLSGQCHAFARTLCETPGWKMVVLISESCSYDSDLCTPEDDAYDGLCSCRLEHVMALRPDGMLVDARGAHAPARVPGYEGQEYVELDARGWAYLCASPQWRRPAVAVARTFTAPLLAELDATTP